MDYHVTFDCYDAFIGGLEEKEFAALLPSAVAIVRNLIGYNELDDESADFWREAVCIAVSKLAEYGIDTPVSGFSIGSFSVTGANAQASGREIAQRAVMEHLSTTGLLWGGVR